MVMILTKLNGDFKHKHDDDDNGWYLGEPRASWALALTMGRKPASRTLLIFPLLCNLLYSLYFALNTFLNTFLEISFQFCNQCNGQAK